MKKASIFLGNPHAPHSGITSDENRGAGRLFNMPLIQGSRNFTILAALRRLSSSIAA